jgi:hypothetical protein
MFKGATLICRWLRLWHGHPGRVSTGWKPVARFTFDATDTSRATARLDEASSRGGRPFNATRISYIQTRIAPIVQLKRA